MAPTSSAPALEGPEKVLAQALALDRQRQAEGRPLLAGRVVLRPADLALSPALHELEELARPELRGACRGLDVDVRVLPGERHHLLVPGLAEGAGGDDELGKGARHPREG